MTGTPETEDRIVVFAPLGRDGPLMTAALREAGFQVYSCPDAAELPECIDSGIGLLVLTMEALEEVDVQKLGELIRRQPPWSDLPIVLLAGSADRAAAEQALWEMGNVTVLERPVRLPNFMAAILAALRARRRQYEMRDLLLRTEVQQAHIEALNERLQRAMTETHHRVKNNLQIIAAIIDLRVLDGIETLPVDEFRRLGLHVRTLASVHDLLTQEARIDGQANRVSAKLLLEKLLPILRQTSPTTEFEYDIDDAQLQAQQAASLTMVANELVSNAIKHGKSRVSVRFSRWQNEAMFEVMDDGNGFPPDFDPRKAANVGLELVEAISCWDLAGRARYENTPAGAKVSVTFPLERRTSNSHR